MARTANSKELIVDAYIALAYEIGAANITLQKIADKAGVAFSTVRYYFTQSDFDIHDEGFKRVMEKSLVGIQSASVKLKKNAALSPIHAYVDSMFHWITEDPENATYLIYTYYLAASQVEAKVILAEVNTSARKKVQSALLESIGLELYKPVKDSAACAASIHACVVGHGFIAMTMKTKDAFKTMREQCILAIDALINSESKK
ncbi:TetR/AcrR family transcriptional regulator [Bdellovibrio sp. HCB288]|uniref:TetR/AcrR family transcriptional regulator n=1 Tax=Bdellovibrio sp. HCB288 TaxID=3394355 RepID=UPI0039B49B22